MMARPRKAGFPLHLHIDPYVWVKKENHAVSVDGNARLDKALAWYNAQPSGDRTRLCWDLIIAAVNGELGVAPAVVMGDDDATENKSALNELLKNMAMDEE